MSDPYVPAPAGPDPARDARVAVRRAEDARRAGLALDRLLADDPLPVVEVAAGRLVVRCSMWPHAAHGECAGVRGE